MFKRVPPLKVQITQLVLCNVTFRIQELLSNKKNTKISLKLYEMTTLMQTSEFQK